MTPHRAANILHMIAEADSARDLSGILDQLRLQGEYTNGVRAAMIFRCKEEGWPWPLEEMDDQD